MKLINAKVATFHAFFRGAQTLVVSEDVHDEAIRAHIARTYSGGNWLPSSLVIKPMRLKERRFNKVRTQLPAVL